LHGGNYMTFVKSGERPEKRKGKMKSETNSKFLKLNLSPDAALRKMDGFSSYLVN
jgi:hypothetical protein